MTDRIDPLGLLRLLPRVRRARGYRLYAETGKRFVDLWQSGGAAALGHTPPGVLLAIKDSAARGLFCPFPSAYEGRFSRALGTLLPERRQARWYADAAEADRALRSAGFGPLSSFVDPAVSDPVPDRPAWWRPWLPAAGPLPPVVAPVIPLPHPARPVAFLVSGDAAAGFPPSGTVSPVVLAAAARALADLASRSPHAARRPGPALEKAVPASGRTFRGPYLRFPESGDEAAYRELFSRFLDRGFLLPPDPELPAILPDDLSRGEETALAGAFGRD